MIENKRMKFIKNENGINCYLFTPSLFSLYFNDKKRHSAEPSHRFSMLHILHMLWYIVTVRGGYRILYLEKSGEILSYIIFIRANNQIIRNCGKNDYYTIYLWTYPEHRGKGLAVVMSNIMLQELQLPYKHFYKTISKDNFQSMRVADKAGFKIKCESVKTRWLHTIDEVDVGEQNLYWYTKK